MTKSGRPTDFDYAMSGAGMQKVEDPRVMAERVKRAALAKQGLLDEYLSGLPDATDSEGEPIPMGQRDRELLQIKQYEERAAARAKPKPAATIPPDFSTEIAETLARQGRDSDDPDYQRLCDGKRYPTQGAFLRELEALGRKAGAKPKPEQDLEAATQEWEQLHKNPTAGGEAGKARRRELQEIIRQLEAAGD